jgi:hypothetical protein
MVFEVALQLWTGRFEDRDEEGHCEGLELVAAFGPFDRATEAGPSFPHISNDEGGLKEWKGVLLNEHILSQEGKEKRERKRRKGRRRHGARSLNNSKKDSSQIGTKPPRWEAPSDLFSSFLNAATVLKAS